MDGLHTHSPEPWIVDEGDSYYILSAEDKQYVAVCHREDKANAKRIVECVNALAGIEDPVKMRQTWDVVKELELDKAQKLKEHLQYAYDTLKRIAADTNELHPSVFSMADIALKQIGDSGHVK